MPTALRVLFIDDSEDDALLLAHELKRGGYDLYYERVDSPEAMKAALEARPWDVVVSDYSMPLFSGGEALKVFKANGADIPFILVSGRMGEEAAVALMKAGAHNYVPKDKLKLLVPSLERELREVVVRQRHREADDKVVKLNRIYSVLNSVNHLIIRSADRSALFEGACRIAVDEGLFKMAWVGLVDDDARTVVPVACVGCEEGYLKDITISSDNRPEGNGPTGTAVRTVLHCINNDTEHNPVMQPWRDEALRRGFRSSASFPLTFEGKSIGTFTVYADKPGYFDEEEVGLLDGLAADISYAMWSMEQGELRKKAEAEAGDLSEKLRMLVDEALIGAYIIQDGRFVFVNPRFEELSGYSTEELLAIDDVSVLVHPDDRGLFRENLRKRLSGEVSSVHYEFRAVKKGGEVVFLEVFSSYTVFKGKQAVIGTALDITSRKEMEEELQKLVVTSNEQAEKALESERKFRAVVQTASDAIITIDSSGNIVSWNEGAEKIFGYTSGEAVGRQVTMIVPENYRDRHLERLRGLASGEKPSELGKALELNGLRKDGAEFPVELSLASWATREGVFYTGIIRDITERKVLDQQKADFYAMVTHDLKSPLVAIQGYTDLLLLDPIFAEGENKEMLSGIQRSSLKLVRMAEDFLTVSRIEAGRLKPKASLVDIDKVINEAFDEYSTPAKNKGLKLSKAAAGELPKAFLDRRLVERALHNLIQNAINYTPSGGTVTLNAGCWPEKDKCEFLSLSVSDTGPGIPPEDIDKVFEKYYRSPGTATVKGTGLGLSIVKAIAEAHGGRVEVESEFGAGCTFRILLPYF